MSDELTALVALAADFEPITASLSPDTLAVLFWTSRFLEGRRNWINRENPLDVVTDSDWDTIEAMVAEAMRELMTNMIGEVKAFATDVLPPNILLCDGASYARADYPDLYAAIDTAFIVDADNFVVPDLRERFVMGTGTTINTGDEGGQATVTLGVENLPAHSHSADVTDAGHLHSEIAATPTVINGGLEAPAVAAEAIPASTGLAFTEISVAIGDTGDGEAVEILPPFMALVYGIVAQ